MKISPTKLLGLILGLLAFANGHGLRAAAATVAVPGMAGDFAWFSGLGFPEVKERRLVRVATGQWRQSGNNAPRNQFSTGFLLGEEGREFWTLSLDLFETRFTNSQAGVKEHERVGLEPLDLRAFAAAQLQSLRKEPGDEERWRRFGERLAQRGEVFVLAWGCWRNGLTNEAAQLYAVAVTMPSRYKRDAADTDFRTSLERDLAHALMWRAVLSFGNPRVSRRELLKMFERIERSYVRSEQHERAKTTAATLRRLIAEDDAHAAISIEALAKLPVKEQVAEWIFRLREQNGQQWSQPGSCDVFSDFDGGNDKGATPAHQLARLGHAAVPQLIAALDDPTFSRSVGYHRNFYFSHTVLTVGDCALQILERIGGRSFSERRTTSSYLSKDGDVVATRKAVQEWWHDMGANGERQVLIKAVSAGGDDAPTQARMLAQRYPEALAEALIAGAKASKRAWTRASLVGALGTNAAANVGAFLRQEMRDGPFQAARVNAANELRRRGEPGAMNFLLGEWERGVKRDSGDEPATDALLHIFVWADSAEVIDALAGSLAKKPVDVRLRAIEKVGLKLDFRTKPKVKPLADSTLTAMERLLVGALEDTEERSGLNMRRKGKSISDPRICDLAALHLAEQWPGQYAFDIVASFGERERQRLANLNVWRRKNNLPEVTAPARVMLKLAAAEATKVTQIQWATNLLAARPLALERRVAAFKDQRLDADSLVKFLCALTKEVTREAGGISVKWVRDGDLTGVRMFARMLPAQRSTTQTALHTNQGVKVGGRGLTGSSSVGDSEHFSTPEAWQDFQKHLTTALTAAPETTFEIGVSLVWEIQ